MRSLSLPCIAGTLLSLAGISEARAQDADAPIPNAQPTPPGVAEPTGERGWEFSATAYLWASGLEGTVGAFPALPSVEVNLSFGDVLENLDLAAMAVVQARKGRFVMLADLSYIDLSASREVTVRDPLVLNAELDTSTFTSTVAAGYRAVDQGPLSLDLLGGVRVTTVDTRLAISRLATSLVGENSETWVDPVVGARLRAPLAERLSGIVYGDVGGFGVSSDVTWQIVAGMQYQLGRTTSLAFGWRHYAVDYENDGFVYDVAMSGPVLGFTLEF